MSEYQYYEFQALDRPLTKAQMAELRAVSSRAEITPYSFVNEYNWGDLKGDPRQWMERYFDAFLYTANWGSRRLMLRLPASLLDPKIAKPYCVAETLSCWQKKDFVVLSFEADLEDSEPDDAESSLASLVTIRSDLMRGDHRALYLGWLLGVQLKEVDDDELEPLLPPQLGDLNGSLECLADFLRIDFDLIAAAAESSVMEQSAAPSRKRIDEWVRSLRSEDKDAIITRLIEGDDPHLSVEVRQRATRETTGASTTDKRARRTAGEILARAKTMRSERKKNEAEKRARENAERERAETEARKKRLQSLVRREKDLWSMVDKAIATRQPRRYDEAVSLLRDLHDLAELKGKGSEFKARMDVLQQVHSGKGTLIERFRRAKLL